MELLFSYTKIAHGRRIYGKDVSLRKQITQADLEKGYDVSLTICGCVPPVNHEKMKVYPFLGHYKI